MSSTQKICAGCRVTINDRRYLICTICGQHYDLICANVPEKRFYNTMTREHKDKWKCVLCLSKLPKSDNTNTPVRATTDSVNMHRGASVASPLQLDMSVAEQSQSLVDTINESACNITIEMSDFQSFVMEMRAFRDEIRNEIRANRLETKRLNDSLTTLAGKIADCENRLNNIDDRVAKLENCSSNKNLDTPSLAVEISQLKAELNDRDQDLLLSDIEVTCIPEQKGENLMHIMSVMASKLGVSLSEHDVISAVRVGRVLDATQPQAPTVSRPRPIVVRLAHRAIRDKLLEAIRTRRGTTTEGLALPGKPCRFFINERLTKQNRQLFRKARDQSRELGWRYVWTRDGKIFARQHPGNDSPRHRLRTEADLVRVFGSAANRTDNH